MAPIVRNPRIKPLKELAQALGANIKVEYTGVGEANYVLFDNKNERLCCESDTYDMLDSIQAYYGSHSAYNDAVRQFHYMVDDA